MVHTGEAKPSSPSPDAQHSIFSFLQAKQNESKYTGVSSDDARMGGFGSSTGFGSDTASSRGTSALGGSALGGLGGSSSRMGGFSSSDYRRSGRYDSDSDPGHHYNSGDLDADIEVQVHFFP